MCRLTADALLAGESAREIARRVPHRRPERGVPHARARRVLERRRAPTPARRARGAALSVAIAQTNLQLDRQLDRAGWPVDDRVRVAAAYDLASRLFTGQYRPNGKTFVAHLCGTASIAQLAAATVDETVAALVHAAYDYGDFGDGRPVVTDRKRAEVRAVIGAGAEALVAGYAAWPWWDRLTVLHDDGAGALTDWERPLAFLRLANELEERVDLGTEYSAGRGAIVYPLDDLVACAQRLDRQMLVELAAPSPRPTTVSPCRRRCNVRLRTRRSSRPARPAHVSGSGAPASAACCAARPAASPVPAGSSTRGAGGAVGRPRGQRLYRVTVPEMRRITAAGMTFAAAAAATFTAPVMHTVRPRS